MKNDPDPSILVGRVTHLRHPKYLGFGTTEYLGSAQKASPRGYKHRRRLTYYCHPKYLGFHTTKYLVCG